MVQSMDCDNSQEGLEFGRLSDFFVFNPKTFEADQTELQGVLIAAHWSRFGIGAVPKTLETSNFIIFAKQLRQINIAAIGLGTHVDIALDVTLIHDGIAKHKGGLERFQKLVADLMTWNSQSIAAAADTGGD